VVSDATAVVPGWDGTLLDTGPVTSAAALARGRLKERWRLASFRPLPCRGSSGRTPQPWRRDVCPLTCLLEIT
jgi:hypothetical protein